MIMAVAAKVTLELMVLSGCRRNGMGTGVWGFEWDGQAREDKASDRR